MRMYAPPGVRHTTDRVRTMIDWWTRDASPDADQNLRPSAGLHARAHSFTHRRSIDRIMLRRAVRTCAVGVMRDGSACASSVDARWAVHAAVSTVTASPRWRGFATKKAASKSRANQGKRSKGKGPVAIAISANAESTTRAHRETYLASIAPAVAVGTEGLSAEEREAFAARAKAYSREKMRADRAFQMDINEKIRIKKAAIMALPAGAVRDAALVEDDDLFPLKRKLPSHTPPIHGYYEEKQRLAEEAVGGAAAFKR